jgi:hypothetical protein
LVTLRLIGVLVVSTIATILGPPPPTERGLAVFSFVIWLIPLWGIWIDRHREPVVA